ncbi:MAG: hypothetical protein ACD_5C00359G0003 [uncultured bacterium]|nr:MAG: hypothetical protein ACD_5C00359G0003 [uncultured bacterium]
MPPITQETMKLLKEHIGKDVILQGVSCGKEHSYRTKLWRVIDFGVINETPLIGMNSAVTAIISVETGKFLMRNTKINPTFKWNGSNIMWRLRFRSYGFFVAFGMTSFGIKLQRCLKCWKYEHSFCM